MPLSIRPLEESDIPTLVRIELEAFRTHPRIPMLWPRGYTPDLYAFYEDSKNKSFHDEDCRFVKAVDNETSEIIATAEWTFALDPDANGKEEPIDPNEQPPSNWPKGGNWELRRWFKIEWETWRREHFAGKAYIVLDILVVSPDCQSRGAGTKLLSWGCEQADQLGVTMCLESTPAGLTLYKRFGFREVRVLKADMKMFGWTQPYDEEAAMRVWMIREPRSQS